MRAPDSLASAMPAAIALAESGEPSVGIRMCLNMAVSGSVSGREHALEAGDVEDAHVLLLHADQPGILELREQAADGLELQAEVAAELLARHAQVEVGGRIAAAQEALGQVEQEGGEALLGAHRAEQQHHAVVAHDLA